MSYCHYAERNAVTFWHFRLGQQLYYIGLGLHLKTTDLYLVLRDSSRQEQQCKMPTLNSTVFC